MKPGEHYKTITWSGLVADIRAAVGDPTGKLMQAELVEHCRKLASGKAALCAENARLRAAAKITQRQLAGILINEGIIQAAAIEDPFGYDGGKTEQAMTLATQRINELISPNDEVRDPAT